MTACAVYVPHDGPPVYGYDSAVSYGHSVYLDNKRVELAGITILSAGRAAIASWLRYGATRPARLEAETVEEYLHRLAVTARREFADVPDSPVSWLAIAPGAAWVVDNAGHVRRITPGRCEAIGCSGEVEAAWRALELHAPGMPPMDRMGFALRTVADLYPAIVCEPIYITEAA